MATNAALDKPTDREPEMTTILGLRVPMTQVWKVAMGIGVVALVVLVFIFVLMPSGISFLAAKNASGLTSYMALFTGYMVGFLILSLLFFGVVVGILYAVYGPR